jgi:hypothetical protein
MRTPESTLIGAAGTVPKILRQTRGGIEAAVPVTNPDIPKARPPDPMQDRRSPRRMVQLPLTFEMAGWSTTGGVTTLAEGGIGAWVRHPVRIGIDVRIRFHLGPNFCYIDMPGVVSHCSRTTRGTSMRIGVKFSELDFVQASILREILEEISRDDNSSVIAGLAISIGTVVTPMNASALGIGYRRIPKSA